MLLVPKDAFFYRSNKFFHSLSSSLDKYHKGRLGCCLMCTLCQLPPLRNGFECFGVSAIIALRKVLRIVPRRAGKGLSQGLSNYLIIKPLNIIASPDTLFKCSGGEVGCARDDLCELQGMRVLLDVVETLVYSDDLHPLHMILSYTPQISNHLDNHHPDNRTGVVQKFKRLCCDRRHKGLIIRADLYLLYKNINRIVGVAEGAVNSGASGYTVVLADSGDLRTKISKRCLLFKNIKRPTVRPAIKRTHSITHYTPGKWQKTRT